MGLTKEDLAYYQLSTCHGFPCLSQEEEGEAFIEQTRQSIQEDEQAHQDFYRRPLGLLALDGVAHIGFFEAEESQGGTSSAPARLPRPRLRCSGRTTQGGASTIDHQGENEPLSPLSLYRLSRYRGTRSGSE